APPCWAAPSKAAAKRIETYFRTAHTWRLRCRSSVLRVEEPRTVPPNRQRRLGIQRNLQLDCRHLGHHSYSGRSLQSRRAHLVDLSPRALSRGKVLRPNW